MTKELTIIKIDKESWGLILDKKLYPIENSEIITITKPKSPQHCIITDETRDHAVCCIIKTSVGLDVYDSQDELVFHSESSSVFSSLEPYVKYYIIPA